MPQIQLPIFSSGITLITNELGYECRDGTVTYFVGQLPVFQHPEDDVATFRMITSQFVVNGNVRQVDISRAFGVPSISVKRAVSLYREKGAAGFYAPRRGRGASVLTPDVLETLQGLLDDGIPRAQAAHQFGLKPNTVAKAVRAGRLREKKNP